MTVPVDAEASYSFVSTGAATYDIPLRIRDAGDVIVIYSEAHADPAGYSVSAIDQDTPTFTINFSVVPAAAITVMILQSYPIAREVDYNPGQILTADSFNNMLDNLTIMQLDVEAMFDKIAFRYNADEIINITDAMTEIPVPTAEAKQLLMWDTDQWEWQTIDSSGSAAELQLALATASSATDSGAHMVAYWNGTASETIQEVLDGYQDAFSSDNITATTINNQTMFRVGATWSIVDGTAAITILNWVEATSAITLGTAATPIDVNTTNDTFVWNNSTLTAAATTTDPIVATRGWTLNQLQAVVAASPTYADFVTNVAAL